MFPIEPPNLVLLPSLLQPKPRAMTKEGDDRKGKGKASRDEEASPGKPTGKQKRAKGSPSRLPDSLAHAPREMVGFTHLVPR